MSRTLETSGKVRAMRRLQGAVVCLALSGCFFPADRGRVLEGRVDSLTEENKKLKLQLRESEERLSKTNESLQDANDLLKQTARSGAELNVKLDSAMQEIASLRGQVESSQFKGSEFEAKLQALVAQTPKPEDKPVEANPKKEELKRPDSAKEYVELAADKVKAGDVELGRRLYTEYLKKWPRDEQVGEVHFALGETYFTDGKCREALFEYSKVIQDFSKTKSAPQAYLRSGDCFKDLKMANESKLAFEELIKQFPKSEAAKTAKARLAPAKGSKPAGK